MIQNLHIKQMCGMGQIVAIEDITQRIYFIRGVKVMLDWDQAKLYEVEPEFSNEMSGGI